MYPNMFNMVVDKVICHSETVVVREGVVIEGFGRAVQNLSALFYADNGLLASPWLFRLQEALDVPMRLFSRVRLRKNR